MSRKFQCRVIPSKLLENNGRRLDCGPYMSGAIEARQLLADLKTDKEVLSKLTNGIYHAGREGRTWVDSPEYGVKFFGSTDILSADLSGLPFLSKKQVAANPNFTIRSGWTLITRSGTTGRIAYCRPDMDGLACSEHVMRVIPDTNKINSGYLFAYLAGRFGVPLITSGTYGSIIQSIEPEHVAEIPVPRLGKVENEVHELVQLAANLRAEASQMIDDATKAIVAELALPDLYTSDVTKFGISSVSSIDLRQRLDAPYHSPAALEAEAAVRSGRHPSKRLKAVTNRLFKPPIFKRLWVESEEYGRQFVSGNDAYLYEANERRYVSVRTPNFDEFIVKRGWVIFQAAGQIYGLFGRPLFVSGWLENLFCADDLYRIVPNSEEDGAYIYLFLRTPHGQALIKRQASGNSIPRVWDPHMEQFELPWPTEDIRQQLARPVITAYSKIDEALILQKQAIMLVERTIEEGGC
ncbi:TPA: methylation-associated defense system restriction endonuclease subunit S MAD5 [Klebsiella pneumoniae]|uniref:methylation-associated defense system restriction endonuclease subunit S MAD5 n=1 Tax=Klebsiella pneumoniae TaxID=573 RepID=UPI0022A7E713|nr:restriction endonuclease subunit S [Klebsiella pneumoniae]MCZ0818174.1 restriction endonuclease subunit S [Klebsiella pneumoniae]HCC4332812.1 restriction endonuclease subunit S [Klebsiella pneumoniae]HDS2366637.1 restriction endonuclease subunit S [Klebsiella pneumoniae subsp. pneumoniae]